MGQSLQDSGIAAAALPLIDISAPKSPQAVRNTWERLREFRAVMFVSPAAVDWFFRLRPPSCMWPASTLALAPGPGTAAVVRQHGQPAGLSEDQLISPGAEAPQFDSETLWPLLAPIDWNGQKVCIASGGDGAEA
ncbi:MAG TPA: uroporphyrinogen-III synthase, partial [Aquabacterium sp.]|nr:uroporphyrinogen-III synthase [Aquabacterium sp.]